MGGLYLQWTTSLLYLSRYIAREYFILYLIFSLRLSVVAVCIRNVGLLWLNGASTTAST